MQSRLLSDEQDLRIKSEIGKAQAATALERMTRTLTTNAIIGFGALALSAGDRGMNTAAPYWLAVLCLTLIFRGILAITLQRLELGILAPLASLRLMAVGAFMSGVTWASLPFILHDFDAVGSDSGICLMMLGMSTGAVLMGSGSSIVPLAFSLPPQLAVIVSLLLQGPEGMLLALCVTALSVLLYRGSRGSEAIFVDHTRGRIQATMLAKSLVQANSEILFANARLERLANCDPLTGLANRTAFNEALAAGIATCETGNQLALLVVDLDGFKMVNDTLGHSVGDSLLVYISNRMRHAIEGADVIARLGGDEFAVIYTGPDAVERARLQCDAMLERSRGSIMIADQSCIVGTSIGLSIYPDHATTAEELFVCADMALYRAKDAGRARWIEFHAEFRAEATRRRQIEVDLPDAISSGAVAAWFQPQVTLDGSTIIGFEALVRWNHPTLGPISPPEIVSAAHASRISDRLTGAIAGAACDLLQRLPALGLPRASVAINVSPREFALYSVVDVIDAMRHRYGIDPTLLEIEITEEALLDASAAGEQLTRIEQSGYQLAVDDFGAGHASLTYLTGLKVDRLKIDRGITAGVTSSRQSQNIVAALVGLGRSLSIDVLVEGVETLEDVVVLRSLGCNAAQGYFFARPMPMANLTAWIAAEIASAEKADINAA